ncbi:hypothetical protein [Pseudomonas aeruginosa]|uniref:transglycosylase SLT domain-containing protein n=1 Tax=Pseudomonas aeruginosa TaxID=287 RepID=UPI002FEE63F6
MLRLSMPALLLALAGCATKPPANPDNLCEIFREKPKWLRIPRSSGHPFHEHLTTDSTLIRPPIPRASGH